MNDRSVTIKLDEVTREQIIKRYSGYQKNNDGPYVDFYAQKEGLQVFIYSSAKGYKCVFTGSNALSEAQIFAPKAAYNIIKKKDVTDFLDYSAQIGSDEVGTGDYFGPIIVVAAYLNEEMFESLKQFGINDSKKITDEFILKTVPQMMNRLVYEKIILANKKYNEVTNKGFNMNAIKALLHNQVLLKVKNKISDQDVKFYVDQFTFVSSYYSYLKNKKEVVKDIIFKTKGESYYPSIALASMIARYYFLKCLEELGHKYNVTFPKGADTRVDEFAKQFIKRFGIDELNNVAKVNFKNTEKIIQES